MRKHLFTCFFSFSQAGEKSFTIYVISMSKKHLLRREAISRTNFSCCICFLIMLGSSLWNILWWTCHTCAGPPCSNKNVWLISPHIISLPLWLQWTITGRNIINTIQIKINTYLKVITIAYLLNLHFLRENIWSVHTKLVKSHIHNKHFISKNNLHTC